jgi:predicted aspartyl protease
MEIEVTTEINMGHVNIPVSVNGKGPFSFVLDTGASVTTIGKRLANELGIETREGSRSEARGVGGGIPVKYADAEIGIEKLEFERDEVYVLDFEAIFRGLGSRDGVFGFTTLKHCTISLSYSNERFKLHKGKSQRNLDWIPFEYIKDSHLIGIPVHINRNGPYTFVLDTGAGGTVMDPALARKINLDVQPVDGIARGLGGDVQLEMAKASSMSIGSAKITDNQFVVIDSRKVSPKGKLIENGIVGYDFLKNFEIVIDYPSKQISFIDERKP